MRAVSALSNWLKRDHHLVRHLSRVLVPTAALLCSASPVLAADLHWSATPVDNDYNNIANWSGAPFFPIAGDTAIFTGSSVTDLTSQVGQFNIVDGWTFAAGAGDYSYSIGTVLRFDGAGIVVNDGSITITTNNSDLRFTNNATAGPATIIGNGGNVTFQNTSNAGTANINANAGAAISFFDSASAASATITLNNGAGLNFFSSSSGGDARIILNNGSLMTVLLTQPSFVTNVGSIEGTGSIDIANGRLIVGSNNLSTEFSGPMDGASGGGLSKVGSGTLILSGTNTYTGETVVLGGALEMNTASHGSHVRVETGAVLAGSGQIGIPLVGPGGLEVTNGGTLAPGPASGGIGALTVNGSILLQPGSHFRVDVNAAGQSDRLVSQFGTVDLTGAILDVIAANGNYALSTSYTIIERSSIVGVTGQFADIKTNLAFLDPSVNYAGGPLGGDVILTMTRNTVDFSDVASTPNQVAVANVLEQLPLDDPLIAPLLSQAADGARQAFDAMSGEVHATIAGMLVDQSSFVRDAIFARLVQAGSGGSSATNLAALGSGGPTTVAGLEGASMPGMMGLGMGEGSTGIPSAGSELAFWTQGFGSWGDFDGDGNAASLDRTLGGFVSGVDGDLGDSWRAGFAVGYTQTDASIDARLSSAAIDSYHLAAYAGGRLGALALRTGASWTWHDIDTTRQIVFPGFSDHAEASYDGDTGQVFGELALPFAAGSAAFEPFAGLAYVHVDTDGFTEDGGIAALTSRGADQDTGYSRLGLRAAGSVIVGGTKIIPHASAAWLHAFYDVTPDIALAFAGTGTAFGIAGTPIAEDSAFLEAGIDAHIAPDATLGISYQGQIGDGVEDHGLNGRLNWQF